MKIQTRISYERGAAIVVILTILAVVFVGLGTGIGAAAFSRPAESEMELFGAKLRTSNVFIAALFVTVVGAVAGITAWRKGKASGGITVTKSRNVTISSPGATAGDTHYAPPPPRQRYMGDD